MQVRVKRVRWPSGRRMVRAYVPGACSCFDTDSDREDYARTLIKYKLMRRDDPLFHRCELRNAADGPD